MPTACQVSQAVGIAVSVIGWLMRFKSILINTIVIIIGPLAIEAQTIGDIRVSNEAPFSVSIGWVTDSVSEGYVRYGNAEPSVRVDDIRGVGIRDDVHYVQIERLEPETSYMFEVVSGDSYVRDLNFTTLAVTPLFPPELSVLGRIATSGSQSKTIWQKNYLVAWGLNEFGQTDVPHQDLPEVTAIAAGRFHNLALKSDGTVIAWGRNNNGQADVPDGLADVTAVAGGNSHSLALKSDGTVVAWGNNADGQADVPDGLADVKDVAGGYYYSLAIKSDSTVVAWGYNQYGQTTIPEGLADVIAVDGGQSHGLALKSDGTVVAWGRNDYGQADVPDGLTGVTAIAAGRFHSLALKSDGTVVAWGSNSDGQAEGPAGLEDIAAVAGGHSHSLALKSDSTVVAWGSNSDGQTEVPEGLADVTAIAGGGDHGLALVENRGSDAIVYVTIVRGDLRSRMLSTFITVDTNDDWKVNLGNLKSVQSNKAFLVELSDIIEIFAQGGQLGLGLNLQHKIGDGNGTFLDLGTLQLSTDTRTETLQFEPGLNLIAPPFYPYPRLNASDLMRHSDITEISRWSDLEKLFQSVAKYDSLTFGSDFSFSIGNAYFVRSNSQHTKNIEGISIGISMPMPLYTGLNLLSIAQPNLSLSAFDVLEQIHDGTEITRFDRASQLYTSAVHIGSRAVGEDFPVTVGEGYFVRVRAQGVWSPSVATPRRTVSVRDAGIRYGGLKRIPAFTSTDPKVRQASGSLIISNVSSTSATISWLDNNTNKQRIQIGPSSGALNHEIRPAEVTSADVQQVELVHLAPETTYYIRLITENSTDDRPLYQFTTSKIDVGNPYSLFGRLVESDEITPAPQNLITVSIDRQSNTSDFLSTLTDAEGYWTVNLGNLKDPETGMPFTWQVGDPIQIIAHGIGGTQTRDTSHQITGNSPQNTVPVYIKETEQKRAPPNRYSLGQNFPNPFNPSTKISYAIANNQAVYTTLTVFNILGQKIKTLVSRMHQPGRYEVIWDGTDSIGREMTSGVYFYRLKSGPHHDTRSMMLLR